MRITGAANLERWRGAIIAVLREIGLEVPKDFPIEISSLELNQKIAEELNMPFAAESLPLRAFVATHPSGDHFLGVIFDHWFADSPSIRLLMQRFFYGYRGRDGMESLPSIHFTEKSGETFGKGNGILDGFEAFLACVRNYLRHRRAHRVKLRDPLDFRADFFLMSLPNGLIHQIRAAAKKCDATVNDLFLAVAAQVLGERTVAGREGKSQRRLRAKRDRVGLAAAVDLRPLAGGALDDVFGFFLSYFTVVLASPERRQLTELVAAIAHHTGAIKSKAYAIRFILSLRIARLAWDAFRKPRSKAQLFQKGLPLLAGISNVNLTGSWIDRAEALRDGSPRLVDYFRVSPVGPLLPLVFTLSTIRDRLTLGLTFRTTAFSRSEAKQIGSEFAVRLLKI